MSKPRIVAVGGGKGGTGKSLLVANIGIFLATLGKRVVMVDAALGSANLHIFTGVARPERAISEAIGKREAPLDELITGTSVPGLRLLSGARDPLWTSSPEPMQIHQLLTAMRSLDADYVLVDLASGTASYTLDLFVHADVGVVVAVPEPTSIELAYRFLRSAFMRRLRAVGLAESVKLPPSDARSSYGGIPSPLDLYLYTLDRDPELAAKLESEILGLGPHLVINCARSKADTTLGPAMVSAARRRLGLPISYLGHLEYDEAVWVAVKQQRPLLVEHPESRVSKCIEKVTRSLIASRDGGERKPKSVVPGTSYYELLEAAPTASFEDIRRANRRIREIYGRESMVISGLYPDDMLDELFRLFDEAYVTLMDAVKRKAYDLKLFPDGVPSRPPERNHGGSAGAAPTEAVAKPAPAPPPVERPPMPVLTADTDYTGALLQQIRESKGIDLREIAERSKIGMAYLQALENENYKKLPALVYVRGFLVEYSKILGLDTERVLETYLERYRGGPRVPDTQE